MKHFLDIPFLRLFARYFLYEFFFMGPDKFLLKVEYIYLKYEKSQLHREINPKKQNMSYLDVFLQKIKKFL